MCNFITIIKPTIIPPIRRVRGGLSFCEPNPIRLTWLGYKCNSSLRRNTAETDVYIHARATNIISLQEQQQQHDVSRYKGYSETNGSSRGVKSMKTVRQRNMVNCEMKLSIGEELQTLFHPIVSATKQAAEKTAEVLVPVAINP